jgi:gluconolactonase
VSSREQFLTGATARRGGPATRLLDFIPVPVDEVTNCAFGGSDWKTLFITAGGTLWSIPVNTPGWTPLSAR